MAKSDKMLTRDRLAKQLGKSPWTLRRWERDGLLPRASRRGEYPDRVSVSEKPITQEVDHVIVQGRSVFYVLEDGETIIWMASQAVPLSRMAK